MLTAERVSHVSGTVGGASRSCFESTLRNPLLASRGRTFSARARGAFVSIGLVCVPCIRAANGGGRLVGKHALMRLARDPSLSSIRKTPLVGPHKMVRPAQSERNVRYVLQERLAPLLPGSGRHGVYYQVISHMRGGTIYRGVPLLRNVPLASGSKS